MNRLALKKRKLLERTTPNSTFVDLYEGVRFLYCPGKKTLTVDVDGEKGTIKLTAKLERKVMDVVDDVKSELVINVTHPKFVSLRRFIKNECDVAFYDRAVKRHRMSEECICDGVGCVKCC